MNITLMLRKDWVVCDLFVCDNRRNKHEDKRTSLIFSMLWTCKNVSNFTSSGMLLLLAKDLPKLGAVYKTTCNMKMFDFLVNFKRLLLLILLSLAHTGKGKIYIYIFCHLQTVLSDQASSFLSMFQCASWVNLFCFVFQRLQRTKPPWLLVVKD